MLGKEIIEEFIKKSDKNLARQWDVKVDRQIDWNKTDNPHEMVYVDVKIVPLGERFLKQKNPDEKWYINLDTTMFNDWTDVWCWKFVRALSEGRLKDVKLSSIIQTEEEYYDCEKEVEFNHCCWEYEVDKTDGKANRIQDEYDADYLAYLYSMDVKLTDEESILLSKSHLLSQPPL